MALNIGKKVYRTLQEQVGFNTEQIDKIFEILDGLNIQDNVVAVSDISTPLTTEELEIISRAVAFIAYNGELYIKRSQDSSYAYFDLVFSLSVSGEVISLNSKNITVTLSNGALGTSTVSAATYTSSKIDSLVGAKADLSYVNTELAKKANLAGANFTGAVTAPTFEQTTTNVSVSFNFSTGSPDIQITNAYNRLIVVNGILYAIANIKMKNISGANKNIGGAWGGTPFIAVNLPADVASKIYDIDGVSAHEAGTARKLITSVHASCVSGTLGDAGATTYNDFRFDLTNTPSTNQVACYFNSNQYITLAADEEITLMARAAITLF